MPPKVNKKALQEKQKKVVEDKTFGLKNKNKSKKVQQYVAAVENAVAKSGRNQKELRLEEARRKERELAKAAKEQFEKEQAQLFKTVVKATVVPAGQDPKSVICEFYKAGKCVRGNKCKFSHDVEQARKTAKIDLYTDPRTLKEDTMDKWDQSKLEEVINQKVKGRLPPTDIICKYFLDAIEKKQYGWLWECPNGDTCHYRHCLPPGYVLKSEQKKEEKEEDEEMDIGEKIEEERKKLDLSKCTPLTYELYIKWKEDKAKRHAAEVEAKRKEAEAKKQGSGLTVMSGRDLFRYDPSLFVDDEEADDEKYEVGDAEDEEEVAPDHREDDDADVEAATKAIDEDLFLDDDDVPDENGDDDDDGGDDDDDDDGEEDDDEEKKE